MRPSNTSFMNSPVNYRANGKLLLAGEYLVLEGACALALPLRYGQSMQVEKSLSGTISWRSSDPAGEWFRAVFDTASLEIISASGQETATVLQHWLRGTKELQPNFLKPGNGFYVTVNADYPLAWGWGSSSTLIAMLAQWSGSDPFELHRRISAGSGFDIACAERNQLLFYQLMEGEPVILPAQPGNALTENTWFCFLEKSQDSCREVSAFQGKEVSSIDISEISDLSVRICRASSGDELIRLVKQHEAIIAGILKRHPIGLSFPSFPGAVKSLGAWGGDFAMFVSTANPDDVHQHLQKLGFSTFFRYPNIAWPS